MFYDFIPCHHCKNYDKDRAWCNLFLMRKVDGCPCGEEKEEDLIKEHQKVCKNSLYGKFVQE